MIRDQATEYWRLRDALHRIDVAMRAADAATIANVAKRVEVIADDAERPATAWAPGMRVREVASDDTGTVTRVEGTRALYIYWDSFAEDSPPMRWCAGIDGGFDDIEVIR